MDAGKTAGLLVLMIIRVFVLAVIVHIAVMVIFFATLAVPVSAALGCLREVLSLLCAEGFQLTDCGHQVPDLVVAVIRAEGRHAGHADTVVNDIVDAAVAHMLSILFPEFRRLRQHGFRPGTAWRLGCAVTEQAG